MPRWGFPPSGGVSFEAVPLVVSLVARLEWACVRSAGRGRDRPRSDPVLARRRVPGDPILVRASRRHPDRQVLLSLDSSTRTTTTSSSPSARVVGAAIAPKADPGTSGVTYYLELVTLSFSAFRTEERQVPVASGSECQRRDPETAYYTGRESRHRHRCHARRRPADAPRVPVGGHLAIHERYRIPGRDRRAADSAGRRSPSSPPSEAAPAAALAFSGGGGSDATTTSPIGGITTSSPLEHSSTSTAIGGVTSTTTTTGGGGGGTSTSFSTTTVVGGGSTTRFSAARQRLPALERVRVHRRLWAERRLSVPLRVQG